MRDASSSRRGRRASFRRTSPRERGAGRDTLPAPRAHRGPGEPERHLTSHSAAPSNRTEADPRAIGQDSPETTLAPRVDPHAAERPERARPTSKPLMRYLIALLLPPLAVFLCGRPMQAFFNTLLCLCLWVPGVVHACLIVHTRIEDERAQRIIRAVGAQH